MQMLWNGLVGRTGAVGGSDDCDGDISLHLLQVDLWCEMSAAMPGQNMDASALDSIIVTP